MLFQSLRSSPQYQTVYRQGRRYDSSYVTVFIVPNEHNSDRFGITASRKAAKSAVDRNRMKRLLREGIKFAILGQREDKTVHYDWVLNARRSLLKIKLAVLSEELQRIVTAIGEERSPTGIKAVEASIPHQPENI